MTIGWSPHQPGAHAPHCSISISRLPDQRAELYMEVVDTLLTPSYNLDESVVWCLAQLGVIMHATRYAAISGFRCTAAGQEGGREIGERELTEVLCTHLCDRRHKRRDAPRSW